MMGRYGHDRPRGPKTPPPKPGPTAPVPRGPRGEAYYAATRAGKVTPLGCLAAAFGAFALAATVLLAVSFGGSDWDEPPAEAEAEPD